MVRGRIHCPRLFMMSKLFRGVRPWLMFGMSLASLVAMHGNAADAKPSAGLAVTIAAGGEKELSVAQSVSLHVEAGKAASPFVTGGAFTAMWEGFLNADLRGNYSFQADLNGALKVEINGTTVLEATGTGGTSPLTKPIQLNKGPNVFRASFTVAEKGDSFVRLSWTEKPPFTGPIPPTAFTHTDSVELKKAAELRLGRELFLNHRCIQCHTDAKLAGSGVPELKMDAPSLQGIG